MATTKKTPTQKFSGQLSLVIPCYNEEHRVEQMIEGIREFHQLVNFPYEVIVVDDGSTDRTQERIEKNPFISDLNSAGRLRMIKLPANRGKGAALKAGVAAASGTHVLTLDADMATRPAEVLKWMAHHSNQLPEHEIWIASREHKDSVITENAGRRSTGRIFNLFVRLFTPLRLKDSQCGFKLYPAEIAKKLFSAQQSTGWAHDVELMYRAQINGLAIRDLPITWITQSGSKISPVKDSLPMLLSVISVSLRMKWDFFVASPIKMLRENHPAEPGKKRESLFRMLFFFTALLLFLVMTTLSFQYGITGDDLDQKVYGESVLNYYLTLGKDTSCLHLKVGNKENLHLYGGLFNMLPAATAKIFPRTDIYDLRHLFDSIAGFLAILFAGLLAKKVGGWRTGYLALILLATWPQFFGQSMNNPKDIPFAFSYVFTIYYLLKLATELPAPRTRTMLLAAFGIALAINMRVGGLLLVGMLFAFVIGHFILSKPVRDAFAADKNSWGRMTKYLLLISAAGYFGGLIFWPYGLQSPFSHPFVALSEITNFSVNIRVLFDGRHLFSSEIPWNYLPTWLWVTTPLAVLLAALLHPFLLPVLRKHYSLSALLLILFAAVFPWAYTVYKESLLYDGLRQMLFLLPLLAVLAAVTWDYFFLAAQSNAAKIVVGVLLGAGLLLPLRFSIANHPNQYVYFNELYGGIKKAYGNFDTDYYMNSIRENCEWLKKNVSVPEGKKLVIATNTADPVNWYLGRDTSKYKITFVRFNERTKKYYDYGIFFSRPLDRSQLLNNSWLGSHAIYRVTADGVPLSFVMERKDPSDFYGEQALEKNEFAKADSLFSLAVKHEPLNELTWFGLGMAQMQQQKLKESIFSFQQSLQLFPANTNATNLLGIAHAQSGNTEAAISLLSESVKQNPNNPQAYYYLGMIYQQRGDRATAERYFNIVKQLQSMQK